MNTGPKEAAELAAGIRDGLSGTPASTKVVVCPPFLSVAAAVRELSTAPVDIGVQNLHFEESGAFTGEVSTDMVKEAGCSYAILGHSERREYFGETDELVAKKVKKTIDAGLNAILCVGEKLEERKSGSHEMVVEKQFTAVANHLKESDLDRLTIAYEPVWAIGTGETATPTQAQEVHAFIRGLLKSAFPNADAKSVHILYGGSMKPANAQELLSQPDVDGGLIGGASLKAASFCELVEIAETVAA